MIATPRNMDRLRRQHGPSLAAAPGVFAYSFETGERYSASPGDYYWLSRDRPLVDTEGKAMVLVRSHEVFEPV